MSSLHMVTQFTFRVVPTVALTTGDSTQLGLCHLDLRKALLPRASVSTVERCAFHLFAIQTQLFLFEKIVYLFD